MAYTAQYVSGDLGTISIDIAGNLLAGFAGEADTIAILMVVTIVVSLIAVLLASIFGLIAIPLSIMKR